MLPMATTQRIPATIHGVGLLVRAPIRDGARPPAAGAVAPGTAVPQLAQNRAPGASVVPQPVQGRGPSAVPQEPQKFPCEVAPQRGQVVEAVWLT